MPDFYKMLALSLIIMFAKQFVIYRVVMVLENIYMEIIDSVMSLTLYLYKRTLKLLLETHATKNRNGKTVEN